ncbi:hypothetical protein AA985_07060 [Enterococcus cecorum]|nr:hypothetical protein AA985_07060 [Enterococcus cecorum]
MSSYGTPSKQVVNRLGQLRADKVCPPHRESPRSKDFPRCGGLYAEVASRFIPSITKVAEWARGGNKKTAADIMLLFLRICTKILNYKV